MTQEDIIRMARQSGMAGFDGVVHAAFQLEAFAALVRAQAQAEEREACAKVCEGINSAEDYYGERPELVCAAAIRARGNT